MRQRLASPRVQIGVGLGLLVLFLAVWLTWHAIKAAIALDDASTSATQLQTQLMAGDVDAARTSAADLRRSTGSAVDHTDVLGWGIAEHLPIVGDDARALATVADQLDAVASQAVPTVIKVGGDVSLKTFSPRHGKIDLAAVRSAAPAIRRGGTVLATASREIGAIDTDGLIGRFSGPVSHLQDQLAATSRAADTADVATRLLPSMLGGEGRRRYLLIIQNNAETRSLGGLPGSLAVLEARKGKVTMTRQGSAADVDSTRRPVVRLNRGERQVLSSSIATDLRDTTTTPDFPRAARIASALTARSLGGSFDGVVSVDPIVLASLLRPIGAVDVDGIKVTADNAVEGLLHTVYVNLAKDLAAQDQFFADTARAVFNRFVSGRGDPVGTVRSLVHSASDRRISVWSRHAAEQKMLAGTGVSGALPGKSSSPQVGVYLSDAAGGKMQYYLSASTTVSSEQCTDDGRQTIRLVTRLQSNAPADRSTIPLSVAGRNPAVRRGDQRLNVRVFAPAGGRITSLRLDTKPQTVAGGTYARRPAAVLPVRLAPGQSVTIVTTVVSAAGQRRGPVLTTTPTVSLTPTVTRVGSSCE